MTTQPSTTTQAKGPLSGIKVLDFTTLLPGPYATQMLADMGAEIVRIESANRFDMMREVDPKIGSVSYAHASVNRGKRSLALDLKKPEAIDIIEKLVEEYDIVVEGFRPGVMNKLGIGYDALSKINPKIIYCSISGYGQTGPLSLRAGHDINYLSLSGLASFSGRKDTGPVLAGTQIADIAGGSHHAVMGILAAVIERQSSGVGQYIDISMSDAALALTTMFGSSFLGGGEMPGLSSNFLNGGTFYDYYRTADDRYLSIGSLEPQFSQAMFGALGKPEWQPRAAATSPEDQAALKADIQAILEQKTLAQWQDIFAGIDACVEPVLNLEETCQLPHFQARDMFVTLTAQNGEQVTQINSPIKFSRSRPDIGSPAGVAGEHSRAILQEQGFDQEAIDALLAANVVTQQ